MRICTVAFKVLYQYQYCVWCLHVVLWCVYIYPIITFHPPPPPVLSVPASSKGRVSATSLQRSRSDVDVNAAAIAKHRYVGQTRAAGHLPPGSYSSLGKGPARWNEWLIRCRHQSAGYQRFVSSDGLMFVTCGTFSKGFRSVKALHTSRTVSKDKTTINTWYSCLGWPFSFHLLFPPSFSLSECKHEHFLCMHVLYVKLILHVD